jgi:predicted membrane-bound spermidine synthase
MFPSLALPSAFFLSGAAGLIFQVVWLYRCGLVLGSSVAAATVVLSGFMAGLAIGNALAARFAARVRRPLLMYASLELVVAVAGVTITAVLPHVGFLLAPLVRAIGGSGAPVNALRFGVAFALLVLPATAMGATLPVLVGALCQAGNRFGTALGRLYGWNTLGAVAGVIVSEVTLVDIAGVEGSAWIAAALNVCAATIALMVKPEPDATRSPDGSSARGAGFSATRGGVSSVFAEATADRRSPGGGWSDPPRWPLLAATALSGTILLALEVAWFRFLSMYVLVTSLAMSLMLAVVLAGIGFGGLVASAWLRRRERAAGVLPLLASLSGLAVVGSYAAFEATTTGTQVGEWSRVLWFASVLTLPTAALSGAIFTLIGDALHRQSDAATADAGRLTLANTAGAICGPPLAAYVLLPLAGMERTFLVLAMLYGLVSLLTGLGSAQEGNAATSRWTRGGRPSAIVATAVLLLALGGFPFGAMGRYFLRAASAYADDGSAIVATREGPSETLFVMQQQWLGKPVYSRLITNGFSMSGTALQGQRYMRAFAYYPMLLHDGPLRNALVVCYGVGVTVGAVTHIPSVETIDVAEISSDVVSMSDAIYPAGARPLDDPRVRLHIEDGRFFLQTTAARFDLITGEPPPPRTPGTVNIYTREYFQLVRDRLNEGGTGNLLGSGGASPSWHGRQHNRARVLRGVQRLFALERDAVRPDARRLARRRRSANPRAVLPTLADARPRGAAARGWLRKGRADRRDLRRRCRLSARACRGRAAADRRLSAAPPAARRPALVVRPSLRNRSRRDTHVSVGARRITRPCSVQRITTDTVALAHGVDRAVRALLRSAGDHQPRVLGRRPSAAADRGSRPCPVDDHAAHPAAVDSRQRRGEAADWRRGRQQRRVRGVLARAAGVVRARLRRRGADAHGRGAARVPGPGA